MKRSLPYAIHLTVAFFCLSSPPFLGPPGSPCATTICDTDPGSVRYQPTVDPALINNLLGTLGSIPITYTFDTNIRLLYAHTLHLTVRSSINLAATNFLVTPNPGSIRVQLNLPAWTVNMVTSMSHAACRNCQAEFDACVYSCVRNPGIPCFGLPLCCETECSPAKAACEIDAAACSLEASTINALLSGHTAGLSFSSATVTQIADVCVTGGCDAVHPLESTTAVLNGFRLILFPETDPLGVGRWLNGVITGLVNWAVDLSAKIRSFFVETTGQGILINALGFDIENDGRMPVQPVLDCLNTGCSTAGKTRHSDIRSFNLVFCALPVGILLGLILWSKRRERKES